MLTENLYEKVLIEPCRDLNAKKLYIVSGYATPAMVFKHFTDTNCNIEVNLLLGMAKNGGLSIQKHHAFQNMVRNDFAGKFNCSYVNLNAPVHSKTYAWFNEQGTAVNGFVGSANYSQNAFSNRQNEAMTNNSAVEIYDYYHSLLESSVDCTSGNIDELFTLTNERFNQQIIRTVEPLPAGLFPQRTNLNSFREGVDYVRLSLLATTGASKGRVPDKSGLNWGQREGREPNQAYIAIPSTVQNSGFFPNIAEPFILYTDDDKYLDCVRAQANGKGLQTYRSNSILGSYFRNRLGVAPGVKVYLRDLERYGRTDVVIYKIDDENYYMDFSV